MEFRDNPSNSTVSTTNDAETFFVLLDILFGQSKALIFLCFHIVEMNSYTMFAFPKANVQMIMFGNLNDEIKRTLR